MVLHREQGDSTSVEELFAAIAAYLRAQRRRPTIAEQWAAGLAAGEAEGPF